MFLIFLNNAILLKLQFWKINWPPDYLQPFCQVYLALYRLSASYVSPRTWGGVKVGRGDSLKAFWLAEPRRILGKALGFLNAVYGSLSLPLFPSSLLPSSGLIVGRCDYPEEMKYFCIKLYYNKYRQMLSFSVVPHLSVDFKQSTSGWWNDHAHPLWATCAPSLHPVL